MKSIIDFPDLKDNIYNNLSLKHFGQGLDINTIIDENTDIYTPTNHFLVLEKQNKKHILYLLLESLSSSNEFDEKSEQIYNFAVNSIISLFKSGKIEQEYINNIAFYLVANRTNKKNLIEFLIKNKMIDINVRSKDGYTLLMCTKEKLKIDYLIQSGCDITLEVNNLASGIGRTAYDIAVNSKKKSWIQYLKPYISKTLLKDKTENSLTIFKNETKTNKQLKLYWESLKAKNLDIVNEIINNQKKYEKLIQYYDGHGKNLIFHAITQNSNDVLEKLLEIQYYKENKNALNKDGYCYTTAASFAQKYLSCKILFKYGFRDNNVLIESFSSERFYPNTYIFDLMIDEGYKPELKVRLKQFSSNKLENEKLSKKIINNFFKENKYLLNLSNINLTHQNKLVVPFKGGYPLEVEVRNNTFKILSLVLSKQKVLDPKNFEINFNQILGSIGQNSQKAALRFASIIMEKFPTENNNLLDYLAIAEKREWLINLNKENLEKALYKIEKEETQIKKKIKI